MRMLGARCDYGGPHSRVWHFPKGVVVFVRLGGNLFFLYMGVSESNRSLNTMSFVLAPTGRRLGG